MSRNLTDKLFNAIFVVTLISISGCTLVVNTQRSATTEAVEAAHETSAEQPAAVLPDLPPLPPVTPTPIATVTPTPTNSPTASPTVTEDPQPTTTTAMDEEATDTPIGSRKSEEAGYGLSATDEISASTSTPASSSHSSATSITSTPLSTETIAALPTGTSQTTTIVLTPVSTLVAGLPTSTPLLTEPTDHTSTEVHSTDADIAPTTLPTLIYPTSTAAHQEDVSLIPDLVPTSVAPSPVPTTVVLVPPTPTLSPVPATVVPTPPMPIPSPVPATVAPVPPTPIPSPLPQPPMAVPETPALVAASSMPAAAPQAAPCGAPTIGEMTLSINTYNYQAALVPTAADDPVYPYPRLNHDQVSSPAPQDYRAVVLENCYLQLTILPELGGRIYRWIDKASGQNLFYQNPVIKPTSWGNRGWWLATGGLEYALPTDEHGLSEASPWSYTLHQGEGMVGVTLTDVEEHSGLMSEVMISLDAGHAYFTLAPRIANTTGAPVAYKFWLNGMFNLGSPQPKTGIEFVLPSKQVTVHSTGDATLPGANQLMDWPIFAGRNMSDYGTWTNYLGVFAAPAAQDSYMGAYNHATNLGIARIFPNLVARGAKIFGPADLDPKLWTDDGSGYFELWGGVAPTFADTTTLNPGEWITWQERWYAIGNMGGFDLANEEAALKLNPTDTMVEVGAASTYPLNGDLVLGQNGQEVARWPVSLMPQQPFQDNFISALPPKTGNWTLSLLDPTGRIVASIPPGAASPQGQTAAPGAQTAALYQPGAPTPTPGPEPAAAIPPTPMIITATPVPTSTPSEPTATPTATTTPIATVQSGQVLWDPRLDQLGIKLTRAQVEPGQNVYRLVSARYQDENEAKGLHHVFVEVVDENGRRIVGQPVTLAWHDGKSTLITEDKPAPEYAANAPLYGEMADGTYEVYVDGAPSDKVSGLGLPGKHHVGYLLTFQRAPATAAEPTLVSPYPVTPTPVPSITPTPGSNSGGYGNGVLWDPRLDQLGIKMTKAQTQPGQTVFRLVSARYQDENESKGLHHVFVEVVDENGQRIVGQTVILAWGTEQAKLVTENKPIPEYAANAGLYGYLPDSQYRVYVDGGPSDVVEGLGLPGKHHVSYWLTFQRKTQ